MRDRTGYRNRMRHLLLALCLTCPALPVQADPVAWQANTYGMPGLIDMPQALPFEDATLSFTSSHFADQTRHSLTFQIAPRLTGSFRYSLLYGISFDGGHYIYDYVFDRSFSLQYQIAREGRVMPAIAVGMNDLLGTGLYASEYLVATRSVGDHVRATVGLGWGRLAGVGSFDNPLGFLGDDWATRNRSAYRINGGQPLLDTWFHGPAALFGGVEWRPDDDWTLTLEYSSDAYPLEDPYDFTRRSQLNFGASYRLNDHWTLAGHYLYGSEIGVQLTWGMNPRHPRRPSGIETAPPAVGSGGSGDTGTVIARSRTALARDGITLHGLTVSGSTARVEIENTRFRASAEAVGRAARALTATLPADMQTIAVTLVERGIPVSTVTVNRADLAELEYAFDNAWSIQARADIAGAMPGTTPLPGRYPHFSYAITPYLAPALFDPDNPVRADFGVELSADWEIAPGLIISGAMRHALLGNLDESTRVSDSVLPHVRSDAWLYDKADWPVTRLTGAWYFRPSRNTYGRVTFGLLERMFAGASAELLYYPAGSRLALGAEIAHVVQRDHDQGFGFLDYEVTTGHVSAYWDMGRGYHAQLDLGRYLAGDWGGTFALDREFGNGWKVGAYFTLTDVSTADFGEGAFDKGIRISIPLGWSSGQPRRDSTDVLIQPILRDGGARLAVDGRLYDLVRPAHTSALTDGWARFWR
ncbi:MAG: YjbH domain-containing protein [Rubellimicrobium sp.]|nr:YjbH domain-containing protein [Rubellimicrobium sp.]